MVCDKTVLNSREKAFSTALLATSYYTRLQNDLIDNGESEVIRVIRHQRGNGEKERKKTSSSVETSSEPNFLCFLD